MHWTSNGTQDFVFVRVPKTASTWLTQAVKLIHPPARRVPGVEGHAVASEGRAALTTIGLDPDTVRWVGTVRNPISWLSSLHYITTRNGVWGGFNVGPLKTLWPVSAMSFEEWLEWLSTERVYALDHIYKAYLGENFHALKCYKIANDFIRFCRQYELEVDEQAVRDLGMVNVTVGRTHPEVSDDLHARLLEANPWVSNLFWSGS